MYNHLPPNPFTGLRSQKDITDFTFRSQTKHYVKASVPDPNPLDPYVFGPPGSGSNSQRYGSGMIPTVEFFWTFYL
jgi:hypothetical protein